MKMDQIQHFVVHFLLINCFMNVVSNTSVKISSPVGNPKEGGILSVYCQVWDVLPGQEVTISRDLSNGIGEQLSWEYDVLPSVDERIFLATRRQEGAFVYFLTIMDVERSDQGSYSCKIVLQSELKIVAEDKMEINVSYFPSESFPKCTSDNGQLRIASGIEVAFNCTSVEATPNIDLQWTATNSRKLEHFHVNMLKEEGKVVSMLRIIPSIDDDGIVFVCTLKSPAFPERSHSCHIGPLFVTDSLSHDSSRDSSHATVVTNSDNNSDYRGKSDNVSTHFVPNEISCESVCRRQQHPTSRVGFWVITTWITCVMVVFFVIFCAIISVKMYCLSINTISKDFAPRSQTAGTQDVYERLECRQQNGSLYMTLEKPNRRTRHDMTTEVTYTRSPTAPDVD